MRIHPNHLCAFTIAAGLTFPAAAADPIIIGWIENIRIAGIDFPIRTKIDTGAKTSSFGVLKLESFKKNDKEWARFSILDSMRKPVMLEYPILRWTRIRRAGTPVQERPVVLLSACLGGFLKEAQFTLQEREGMSYSVLIGRRFLDDKFLVASNKTFLTKPQCSGKP